MQNRDWSLHVLEKYGCTNGPNMLEASFNKANPELIYTGDHSFWRWLPRLQRHKNPDFLVPGPDPEHPRRDLCKVVEVFGDYWHSKKFTGQDPVDHCRELVESYADIGIQCLIVWEKDIRKKHNNVRDVVLDFLSI